MGIDTHELNRVMAEVAGIEIHEDIAANQKYWWHINPAHERQCWSPCTCPIQSMRVKAKLRKMGVGVATVWNRHTMQWHGFVLVGTITCYEIVHEESELIPFALAVQSWWKEMVK